jgi:uncharacterized protein (TIGR02246 family)
MNRWLALSLVGLFLIANNAWPKESNREESAVRKVLQDQVDAWNRGDLEAFMSGYWKSPELTFFSGKDKASGWDATLARYRRRYQSKDAEMGKLSFSNLDIQILGPDSAFVRGQFHLKRTKDAPQGRFTLIFKKLPEGWRIIHDHTST